MSGYELDPGDARIASLQATCARLEQRIGELEQRAVDTDVNLVRLSNRVHVLDTRLNHLNDAVDKTVARLEQRIGELERQLNAHNTAHGAVHARLLVDVNERLARLEAKANGQQVTLDQLWKHLHQVHERIGDLR